jgi:putative endonuclease
VTRSSSRWSIYILRCSDGTLYTGVTNDSARRLAQHGVGAGARYTRSRLPVRLVYEEHVADRAAALRREAAVKRLSRPEKLALIEAGSDRRRGASDTGVDRDRTSRGKLTVRPVYRIIVKKNEKQAKGLYDVLICGHAVPSAAAAENTYRKARACPECRVRVQEYADQHRELEVAKQPALRSDRRRKAAAS